MTEFEMKDSGKREEFPGGAVRDMREGKGRFDLISPIALKRLAIVYQRGAEKYDERNWEKGVYVSRMIDSALRHLYQHLEGMRDEDHLGHAAFNVLGAIHMEEMINRGLIPSVFMDLPNYIHQDCDDNEIPDEVVADLSIGSNQ